MTQAHTFHLRGEYDLLNAAELEVSLLHFAHSNGGGPLTVDAEHLRFIDSSGIGALLRVRDVLATDGRTMRLVNLPTLTRRVVEIMDLEQALGVTATE